MLLSKFLILIVTLALAGGGLGKWDRRAGGEALEIAQHEQDPVFPFITERGWGQRAGFLIERQGSVNASAPSPEVSGPPWERGPG